VAVCVIAPVMVAALGNRNEPVKLFDAARTALAGARCVPGLDHAHGGVPDPERGDGDRDGSDHERGYEHPRF
jgi:hypothetical protein